MTNSREITVVIADDELMVRNLVSSIVRDAGYRVIGVAADGAEAISLCAQLKPDVLLLDVHMPSMSGVKTLKALAKSDQMPCVVILTAEHQSEIVEDCFRLGARNCVHKDTNIKKLPDIIQSSLAA